MSDKLPVLNKEAVLRAPGTRGCPFGLGITVACKNAGDTVLRMAAIDDTPDEKKVHQTRMNRRVYAFHNDGQRCIYADKIVKKQEAVHCDYGEHGQGIRDFAIRPSPYYPRVFYGMGQYGLFSYPVGAYSDNLGAQQTYTGLFYTYATDGKINFQKNESERLDTELDVNNLIKE